MFGCVAHRSASLVVINARLPFGKAHEIAKQNFRYSQFISEPTAKFK